MPVEQQLLNVLFSSSATARAKSFDQLSKKEGHALRLAAELSRFSEFPQFIAVRLKLRTGKKRTDIANGTKCS